MVEGLGLGRGGGDNVVVVDDVVVVDVVEDDVAVEVTADCGDSELVDGTSVYISAK